MQARCKHDWTSYTLQGVDYKCSKCGRYGKLVWRYHPDSSRTQVIRMIERD